MNFPLDTLNASMNLAAGVLALLAAIIAAIVSILPNKSKVAAATIIHAKIYGFFTALSAIASAVFLSIFDMPRTGLVFLVIYTFLMSTNYLRHTEPASRKETLFLVLQVAIISSLFLMHIISRVLSVIEKYVA